MSHHAQLSPEAIQKLQSQRRNSTISAIIIALLLSALIVAVLYFIAISSIFKNEEELVSYSSSAETIEEITQPELTNEVKKPPSAPSSSAAKVIATATPSATAISVPDVDVVEPSLDFGSSTDFGEGWGGSGLGEGSGGGGGAAAFFNTTSTGERIAFVIDYSRSMGNKGKLELMKKELSKSIENLPDSIDYSLIFFAGPAWIAGDKIKITKGDHGVNFTINSAGKKYDWVTSGGPHGYSYKDPSNIQRARWIKSTEGKRKQSLKSIQDTPMVYGTIWKEPLEMAMNMSPKPDIIFFMTDGNAGNDSKKVAKDLAKEAKRNNIKINTIALMEPQARDSMADLAKTTGGTFTMVDADGSVKTIK